MVKDGENISKFSKEAMTLGDDVYAHTGKAPIILRKVYALYDIYRQSQVLNSYFVCRYYLNNRQRYF